MPSEPELCCNYCGAKAVSIDAPDHVRIECTECCWVEFIWKDNEDEDFDANRIQEDYEYDEGFRDGPPRPRY